MKWELISNEQLSGYVWRSEIPMGWLVLYTEDVLTTMDEYYPNQAGYQWRSSITFVPDAKHEWKI